MAGETVLPEIVRTDPVPLIVFATPARFAGCNAEAQDPEPFFGTAPGLACIIIVPPPVGRAALRDVREAVVHSIGLIQVGAPSSG